METKPLFVIKCRTECLCCDDCSRGPFQTKKDAERRIESLKLNRYPDHPEGQYRIDYYDGELLPDDRIVVRPRIFPKFFLVDDVGDLILIDDEDADKIPFDFIYPAKE